MEDNAAEQMSIKELLDYDDIEIVTTGTGAGALRVLELQLEGAAAEWLPDVAGVELVERRNGGLRLLAGGGVDPERVLAEAERVGRVVAFSYGPPSLAELFLELVAP